MIRPGTRYDIPKHDAGIDVWLARRILAGWTNAAIATAGSLSVRTVQRWRADLTGIEDVTVNGYVATFAHRRGKPPKRLTEWRRA